MALAATLVGIAVLAVGLMAVYSSVRVVEEGETEALVVFGETQAVLRPGLNFVPPFVSRTYPIDPRTMTIDRGGEQVSVPTEFEGEVREAAGSQAQAANSAETEASSTTTPSARQRAATVLGWTLFVLGAFGFAVPMIMLGHVFELDRWAVSGLFAEATLWQAVLSAVAALFVMLAGESLGREYGTWGEES